jgi:hypothetical protein
VFITKRSEFSRSHRAGQFSPAACSCQTLSARCAWLRGPDRGKQSEVLAPVKKWRPGISILYCKDTKEPVEIPVVPRRRRAAPFSPPLRAMLRNRQVGTQKRRGLDRTKKRLKNKKPDDVQVTRNWL